MKEALKEFFFYGVAGWAICALLIAGCGLSTADVIPTYRVPEGVEAFPVEAGKKLTHNGALDAINVWIAQREAEKEALKIAAERSAATVGKIDGLVFGSFGVLEDSGLLAAVPGGALIGVIAGYLKRRRGDKTVEQSDAEYDEAYQRGREAAEAAIHTALSIARAKNERETAAALQAYLDRRAEASS